MIAFFRTGLVGLLLVVSIVALELALGFFYTIDKQQLFWTRRISAKSDYRPITETRQLLSPVYGFALRPGWRPADSKISASQLLTTGHNEPPDFYFWPANNYGFLSPVDYPYNGPSGTFYVGVVGGSVANGLALEGKEAIAEVVAKAINIEPRSISIINLAGGGYKQPQQALTLSYFVSIGQKFDLVINLDGLNESYMGWDNATKFSVEPAQPSAQFLFGLQNHFLSINGGDDSKVRALHNDANVAAAIAASTRSAIRHYWASISLNRLTHSLAKAEAEIGQPVKDRRYPFILERRRFSDDDQLARHLADVWYRGSVITQAIARSAGAIYIHALQPNQYVGNRQFSAEEAKLAFSTPPGKASPS